MTSDKFVYASLLARKHNELQFNTTLTLDLTLNLQHLGLSTDSTTVSFVIVKFSLSEFVF